MRWIIMFVCAVFSGVYQAIFEVQANWVFSAYPTAFERWLLAFGYWALGVFVGAIVSQDT